MLADVGCFYPFNIFFRAYCYISFGENFIKSALKVLPIFTTIDHIALDFNNLYPFYIDIR